MSVSNVSEVPLRRSQGPTALNTSGAINGDWLVLVGDAGVTEADPRHHLRHRRTSRRPTASGSLTQAQIKASWRNGFRDAGSIPPPVPAGPAVDPREANGGVENGLQFQSSVAGTIIGLNFYKSATNTGVHVGNLWDATGKINLGTVTFTNETASGWQTANFATPIAIAANTTYIISYHATVDYAGTESFLPTAASSSMAGVLTASVSNGVTQFGPGGFNNASSPAGSFDSEWNYFVDPIFQTAPGVTQTFWNKAATPAVLSNLVTPYQHNTLGFPYTTCVSLANSHIHDVLAAGALAGNNSLATENEIDHFGDDGLDYAGNNIALTHNSIHDNFSVNDGNHPDAMQGIIGANSPPGTYNAFSNILIDSNRIIRQEDTTIPFPLGMQGIDAFDEDWTNMTVTNNVVVTSACWGMALASIHNSLIANNTVLDDGSPIGHSGCTLSLTVGASSHQGPNSSNNTRVTNNFASQIWVFNGHTPSMPPPDHNVCAWPADQQSWRHVLGRRGQCDDNRPVQEFRRQWQRGGQHRPSRAGRAVRPCAWAL